jgi:hypothetical protein
MLCIPAYTASFSCFKAQDCCTWFAGCGKDRRPGALKAHHTSQDANFKMGTASFGCKQLRRGLVVQAASNAADGVPVKEVSLPGKHCREGSRVRLLHAWLGNDQVFTWRSCFASRCLHVASGADAKRITALTPVTPSHLTHGTCRLLRRRSCCSNTLRRFNLP